MGIVGFVVDIVLRHQMGFAALVFGIGGHIYLHRLEIHLRGVEVGFRTHLVGAHMQSVAGDELASEVHTGIAVDRVCRYV